MFKYFFTILTLVIFMAACSPENKESNSENESIDSLAVQEEVEKYDSVSKKTDELIKEIENSSSELEDALKNLDN